MLAAHRRSTACSFAAVALMMTLAAPPDIVRASDEPAAIPTAEPTRHGHASRHRGRTAAPPTLDVRTVVGGLDIPWDVAFLPGGAMLITERNQGTILIRRTNGAVDTLVANVPGLWVSGETGLMSIAVDPRFGTNRRFYICHGFSNGSRHDVRVTAWRVNDARTAARQVDVLVPGMLSTTGRHGGCRLEFGTGGALFIGTGDAARTGSARNLSSLAGKVLRVNRFSGNAIRSNPFISSPNRRTRKIWTFGHRNVQGLAQRPDGAMWSVEHGTFRDDEVNRLQPGGDYGWQAGPGYDESPPMTNFALPGRQIGARWSSGDPTVATSGATWLAHRRWGAWRGRLAVAALENESLRVMRFDRRAHLVGVRRPGALAGTFGRLRSAELGPGGGLYLTTSNGGNADRVLLVTPRT